MIAFRELASRIEGKKIRTYPVIAAQRGFDASVERRAHARTDASSHGNSAAPRGRERLVQRGLRGRGRGLGYGPREGRIQPLQLKGLFALASVVYIPPGYPFTWSSSATLRKRMRIGGFARRSISNHRKT